MKSLRFILVLVFVSGCIILDPWMMPVPNKTGINPTTGEYSFSKDGCFEVVKEGCEKYVRFASDCSRFDEIPVENGAFIYRWGQIGGTHCPTDGYAISGSFVTKDRAEGTIKYAQGCVITSEAKFVAKLKVLHVYPADNCP
jgi:hypothetical protein